MMTKLGCSSSVILNLVEGIFLQGKQLIRSFKLVLGAKLGPRFLNFVLNTAKLVLGANNKEGLIGQKHGVYIYKPMCASARVASSNIVYLGYGYRSTGISVLNIEIGL